MTDEIAPVEEPEIDDGVTEHAVLDEDWSLDPGMVRDKPTPKAEKTEKRPEAKIKEPEDDEPEPEPEEEEEEEEPEPEEETEEPDPDAEVDYDKPAKAGKKEKAKVDEDEPFRAKKEGEDNREYQAKKAGHERKQVQKRLELTSNVLKERELDVARVSKERDELKAQVSETKAVQADYRKDPEYKGLYAEIMEGVRDDAELLTDARGYATSFGDLVNDYLEAKGLEGGKYDDAIKALRRKIVEKLGKFDSDYEEIDADDRIAFETKVLSNLRKHAPNVRKLSQLATTIQEKAEKGISVLKNREYETQSSKVQEKLNLVGQMSDDLIEKAPHTISAFVARLTRDHPEIAALAKPADRDVLEAFHGPRPLTEEDVKRLEANGTDLKKFEADRQARASKSREKMAVYLKEFLLIRGELPSLLAKLAKYEAKEGDEDDERSALRKGLKRPKTTSRGEPEYVPPNGKRKTPALDSMFGPNGLDD